MAKATLLSTADRLEPVFDKDCKKHPGVLHSANLERKQRSAVCSLSFMLRSRQRRGEPGICQITISIREVGLQFNSAAVGINSQINEALLVVDASQVSMDNRMVGAQTQGSQPMLPV
ncbi:hypothetical protein EYF80_037736 [Liparis tanakae]|uniref:Uncharacterized protein n=1 Tax=Liparis tanakae TaxID=230148 RepID=A0A4Z2GEV0_9TELE|nr:hypothetical protein EYF80_037736 [Liparis tanakae]